LLTSAFERDLWPVALMVLASSLLAVVYVWRVVETLYFAPPSESAKKARDAPVRMLIPTYLLLSTVMLFGVWTPYSAGLARHAAQALLGAAP
ncbi:MAG: monovalent cation/H+ antiporter subunit D family protein, partial [Planctomycetota bacterium]